MGSACSCDTCNETNCDSLPQKRKGEPPMMMAIPISVASSESDTTDIDEPSVQKRRNGSSSTSSTPESTPLPTLTTDIITEFRQAILTGTKSMVMYLVEEYPDLIHTKFENGNSCLQTAVKNRKHDAIGYILKSGASPNEQNNDGDTALHLAARNNDIKTVELLLKFDASKSVENNDGELPVTIADELHYDKMIAALGGFFHHENLKDDDYKEGHSPKYKRLKTGDRRTTDRIENFATDVLDDTTTLKSALSISNNDEHIGALDTKRLQKVASEVYLHITDSLKEQEANLMPMEGWVDKKQHSMPYSWQKRWLVMRNGYLLWSDRQMSVGTEGITDSEKKRWDHCIKMVHITEISKITQGKTQRKFKIKAKGRKETIFRAKNEKLRDKWVKELNDDLSFRKQERSFSPSVHDES